MMKKITQAAAVVWPDAVLMKHLWKKHPKYLFAAAAVMLILAVTAAGVCRFDIVAFWTEPGGLMPLYLGQSRAV